MLPAGAAHRRDDRLGGEDGGEVAVVVRDVVRPEQRALAVDRDREPVRVVGPGVVQEHVLDAEDAAVARHRDLGIVDLAALLGRRDEVLAPVLDPLHRPSEPLRGPGTSTLLGVEHHDLGAESAADERRDDPHLRLGRPSIRASPFRIGIGAWVVSQMVSCSARGSHAPRSARFSIAAEAPRS